MARNLSTIVTAVVCALCLLLGTVTPAPYVNELTEQDRLSIIHHSTQIIKMLVKPRDLGSNGLMAKRNSGMLDAVIQMPDLFKVGKK